MKKIIFVAMLLLGLNSFGQKSVAKKVNEMVAQQTSFKKYSLLTPNSGIENNDTQKGVTQATFAKINNLSLSTLFARKDQHIEIEIPYLGQTLTAQLYQVNIFADGFHIDSDQAKNLNYEKGIYYRGIIKGDLNSIVSFNFFKEEFNGVLSSQTLNNIVVAKLDKAQNTTDYIVYSDTDLKSANHFECKVKTAAEETPRDYRNMAAPTSTKCVTMYFEIDYDLYQANNSNTTTTSNWMTSVFNNVQTLYNNDGITTALKSMYIWTTEDPYSQAFDDSASSSDYLYKFNELRPVFDGDLGQLLGIDPGGLGGVAVGINGICTQDNFSYSDVNFSYSTVPTFSWTIMVITHEFGHLLGSPHTHGCHWNGDNTAIDGCGQQEGYFEGNCDIGPIPDSSVKGTIMSYCHLVGGVGINLANGFGPQPAARILSEVNGGSCLSTDCINTCINTVANITAATTSNSSATISWTDLAGATSWQVAVTPFGDENITWENASTNSYTANGLSPNTYYVVRVRPICGFGLQAPNEQTIIVTGTSYCNGIEITDTGGVSDDYTDSETYIRTIIPNLPNKKIKLTFTAFDLEQDYDYLYVYDGNSTSAPDLSAGGFTGNSIPGPFVSSASDGSLTLKFYSDGGVVAPGYVANVACETSLSNTAFEPNIDYTYSPNPTNGAVNITSRTLLSEVLVYNLEGRLLLQQKTDAFQTKVDLAAFATGTYFFKLKFNTKEANFKILKMN
ncbi:T9SS type A sorting domain-containing protein [Flavobacterium sp. CYK-4]|uniref:M12 family metallo-peptidase n=1 Tax=Flavobacterium lotistagni TaxID=2709660 RepID=UPI00140E36F5|nr:M12 family metallo-peptidase [Flavobacterium lotistagni]NHM07817.1 T9SS type A sorting domain-containing protein [Flavobacterium lotistagni]